ncbi:ANTAR domain-containing protein [Marinactinospora thermotolerans]|uniref:Response regulator with putative antiterminator output domain n=1 Tax=Marinactinospora thermotolerans DSM 45154 TaxID=1122192 RepID=A0A1T4SC04_9ACTN|nr:ANTAR domain-containing protein [Marinactinospora thermotolerans]SKA25759.1 Response regulator with putative antiterminator output domain [Marinactinospora thermotolerans DSM 45154]
MTPESPVDNGGDIAVDTIRRTPTGWRVHSGEELPDLLGAMVLADLLYAEEGPRLSPPPAPPKAAVQASETERLRVTVAQLEHALGTRVVIEQAIGVLAERHRLSPRVAFERLRQAARSRGRKVADLAREVVASSADPLIPLPAELAREGGAVRGGSRRRRG